MGLRAAIFVVDDQRSVAEAAARYLRMHGFEVRVETDGWAAVRVLRSDEELIVTFLDVLMPEPTGSQIYNILKQFAPGRLERLVFYTGMTALAGGWLEETKLPIVEKGSDATELLLRWATHFSKLDCSKGPMATKKTPSKPDLDSDPPDDFPDETTEVSRRARSGDVLAIKLKHLENKFLENKDATNERLEKIEGHFEEKGMVGEVKHDVIDIKTDLKIAKSWINRFPLVIGGIFTVLMSAGGAVVYLIHVSEREHDLQLQQQRYDEQKKKYDELLQKTSSSVPPPR
jgi:CheY-like chemotaxis protein